jgi:hypothetical protein
MASTIFAGGLGNVPVIAARPIKSDGLEWSENSGEPSTRLGPKRTSVRTKAKSFDMIVKLSGISVRWAESFKSVSDANFFQG